MSMGWCTKAQFSVVHMSDVYVQCMNKHCVQMGNKQEVCGHVARLQTAVLRLSKVPGIVGEGQQKQR